MTQINILLFISGLYFNSFTVVAAVCENKSIAVEIQPYLMFYTHEIMNRVNDRLCETKKQYSGFCIKHLLHTCVHMHNLHSDVSIVTQKWLKRNRVQYMCCI